jgi:hypothetical protein
MRQTALLFVIAVFEYAANAQFTLRPQIGIEDPTTKIRYNDLASFAPVTQFQPQVSIHADYKFKSGFGPFIGLSTNRSSINYSFNDPETGMTAYNAKMDKMQFGLQAGLQYSSQPIFLNLHAIAGNCGGENRPNIRSGCCSHSSHSCGSRTEKQKATPKKESWTVRLQPSAGISYVPSDKPTIETKTSGAQTSYIYNAGNLKTAIVTGMSFEFARNKAKFLTVSVNYFKGLGNDETTFTTQSATKNVVTTLSSKVSGWNASLGIPLSFTKNASSKTRNNHHGCGEQYRSRCQSVRKI